MRPVLHESLLRCPVLRACGRTATAKPLSTGKYNLKVLKKIEEVRLPVPVPARARQRDTTAQTHPFVAPGQIEDTLQSGLAEAWGLEDPDDLPDELQVS